MPHGNFRQSYKGINFRAYKGKYFTKKTHRKNSFSCAFIFKADAFFGNISLNGGSRH